MAAAEPVGPKLVETLLYESEGTALDFKRDQYPFEGAADHEKAELLKDILAFANSFRTTDAHILIGVKEVEGGRAEVVGVTTHLKDNNLQQFVNSKTNQTIDLSYTPVEVDGKSIGVIRIPRQQRPFHLKKDFGVNPADGPRPQPALRAGVVYFRTGSSTKPASPDDLYRMGKVDAASDRPMPVIDLTFADASQRIPLTREMVTSHLINVFPDEIPDYEEAEPRGPFGIPGLSMRYVNRSFYRDAIEYIHFLDAFRPISFAVRNTASTVASDVVVELTFPGASDIVLIEDQHVPEKPKPSWDQFEHVSTMSTLADRIRQPLKPAIYVERRGAEQMVVVRFGKLQAHELKICESPVHMMCRTPQWKVRLEAEIRADEFAKPQRETLEISASATQRDVPSTELANVVFGRLYGPSTTDDEEDQ